MGGKMRKKEGVNSVTAASNKPEYVGFFTVCPRSN